MYLEMYLGIRVGYICGLRRYFVPQAFCKKLSLELYKFSITLLKVIVFGILLTSLLVPLKLVGKTIFLLVGILMFLVTKF